MLAGEELRTALGMACQLVIKFAIAIAIAISAQAAFDTA